MDRRQLLKSGIGLLCTIPIIRPTIAKKLPIINKLPIPTQKNKIQLDLTPWDTRITDDIIINENSLGGLNSFYIIAEQYISEKYYIGIKYVLKLFFKTAILEFQSYVTTPRFINSTPNSKIMRDYTFSRNTYTNDTFIEAIISNLNKDIIVSNKHHSISMEEAELSSLTLLEGFIIGYPIEDSIGILYRCSLH